MKATIDGIRYSTDRCEELAERTLYNNGNVSGYKTLWLADDGTYLLETLSNRQDLFGDNSLTDEFDINDFLEDTYITEAQEARLAGLGVFEII